MRSSLLRLALVVSGLLLLVRPALASSITFDDSFADNHVEVIFTDIAFTNFSISSNCTFSLADSKATCSETLPIELQADGPGIFDPSRPDNWVEINFLESVGGPVSDTFFFKKTPSSDPSNPVHSQLIFQSDVEGGPALAPLSDPGALIFTGVETPSVTFGGCPPDDPTCLHSLSITIISETEVPEPGSLVLLGSGLVLACGIWRRHKLLHP